MGFKQTFVYLDNRYRLPVLFTSLLKDKVIILATSSMSSFSLTSQLFYHQLKGLKTCGGKCSIMFTFFQMMS